MPWHVFFCCKFYAPRLRLAPVSCDPQPTTGIPFHGDGPPVQAFANSLDSHVSYNYPISIGCYPDHSIPLPFCGRAPTMAVCPETCWQQNPVWQFAQHSVLQDSSSTSYLTAFSSQGQLRHDALHGYTHPPPLPPELAHVPYTPYIPTVSTGISNYPGLSSSHLQQSAPTPIAVMPDPKVETSLDQAPQQPAIIADVCLGASIECVRSGQEMESHARPAIVPAMVQSAVVDARWATYQAANDQIRVQTRTHFSKRTHAHGHLANLKSTHRGNAKMTKLHIDALDTAMIDLAKDLNRRNVPNSHRLGSEEDIIHRLVRYLHRATGVSMSTHCSCRPSHAPPRHGQHTI